MVRSVVGMDRKKAIREENEENENPNDVRFSGEMDLPKTVEAHRKMKGLRMMQKKDMDEVVKMKPKQRTRMFLWKNIAETKGLELLNTEERFWKDNERLKVEGTTSTSSEDFDAY